MEDPILDELHKYREEWAAKFDYDIHAMVADLQQAELSEDRPLVSLPPKRVADISEVAERVNDLTYRAKTSGLALEEEAELNDYLTLEHLGRLAKARLHRSQSALVE